MNRDELINRLKRYEWSDVEFKEARNRAPKSAYETVSAFANTAGGWLVFGVRDNGGVFESVGVSDVDKVQGEFLSTLRSGGKINRAVAVREDVIETDGRKLLVFHVPESPRGEKPIYLDGDIRRSFIRRGACDERCTSDEIERLLRDASTDRLDEQPLDGLDAGDFFDPPSVRWFRRMFDERSPGRVQELSDDEFLQEWGFVVGNGDRLAPTRAAVLLVGRPRHVRQAVGRPLVDYQFINADADSWTADQRWSDRVLVEENLVQAWLMVSEAYVRHAARPFRLDVATLRRNDDPADYTAFREAAINLLIHQDYGDRNRTAFIRSFRDRIVLWNPGDAFASAGELLDGTAKHLRNPAIVTAFRRIGLSEQAGTGMRAIFRNWQSLGHVPPVIENDKTRKGFELRLLRQELLDGQQQKFQARLGVQLDERQARVLAFACRNGRVSLTDAKAVTGGTGPEARDLLKGLVAGDLLRPLDDGAWYGLAEYLRDRLSAAGLGQSTSDQVMGSRDMVSDHVGAMPEPNMVTKRNMVTDRVAGSSDAPKRGMVSDHVGAMPEPNMVSGRNMVSDHVPGSDGRPRPNMVTDHVVPKLTAQQQRIIAACDVPRSSPELMERAGVKHRTHFRRTHLLPLVRAGIVTMTNPDNPRAANQRYVLTAAGLALRAARTRKGQEDEGDRAG